MGVSWGVLGIWGVGFGIFGFRVKHEVCGSGFEFLSGADRWFWGFQEHSRCGVLIPFHTQEVSLGFVHALTPAKPY